jgi:ribosomal-protein-alanine N-acetyltransferase
VSVIVKTGAEAADDLARVHARCFDPAWDAATFRRLMAHDGTFALIARAGNEPSGFALVRIAGGESELLSLGVVPASRRGGLARRLVAAALDRAGIAGATVLVLEVAEDNAAARGLYDAFAFEPVGRRVRYYSRPDGAVDAITMRRRLDME